MTVILTPGCAEVRIVGTISGENFVMIQHAEQSAGISPISAGDLTSLLNAVATGVALTTDFPASTIPDVEVTEVSVRDVGTLGAVSLPRAVSIPGTVTSGNIANSGTSALARMNIGYVPTFKRPGRLNWPGVLDQYVVNNMLDSGSMAIYETMSANLVADINSAPSGAGRWTAVVRSLFYGEGGGTPGHPIPHPRETGITAPIISVSVRPKISGLNRRLRGGKRHR